MASAGSNATAEVIYMSRNIIDAVRPDALLYVTAYCNNPPQEGLVRHFEAVAVSTPRERSLPCGSSLPN